MFKSKIFNGILDKLPATGQYLAGHSFLTVDTKGRIIIEDCDKINAFTDRLLIVVQGNITLTFVGEGLRLKNLSRHGSQLTGVVETIKLERNGAQK